MMGVFFCVLYVVGLGSFLYSWVVGRVTVVLSVDIASSRVVVDAMLISASEFGMYCLCVEYIYFCLSC